MKIQIVMTELGTSESFKLTLKKKTAEDKNVKNFIECKKLISNKLKLKVFITSRFDNTRSPYEGGGEEEEEVMI